jgi:hypothetical protein
MPKPTLVAALGLGLGVLACASARYASSPTDGATSADASKTSPDGSAPPKPIPSVPFSRMQTAPITDDERYQGCHWGPGAFRRCMGMADIRGTATMCNGCLVDADCSGGGRCVDAVLPGPDDVHLKGCAPPDTPCFASGACPPMDACTLVGEIVACRTRDLCVAQ